MTKVSNIVHNKVPMCGISHRQKINKRKLYFRMINRYRDYWPQISHKYKQQCSVKTLISKSLVSTHLIQIHNTLETKTETSKESVR